MTTYSTNIYKSRRFGSVDLFRKLLMSTQFFQINWLIHVRVDYSTINVSLVCKGKFSVMEKITEDILSLLA
jgi:hypothetical protein